MGGINATLEPTLKVTTYHATERKVDPRYATRALVTIAHDRSLLANASPTLTFRLRIPTLIDRRAVAMGMWASKVVAQLMRHNDQIPIVKVGAVNWRGKKAV